MKWDRREAGDVGGVAAMVLHLSFRPPKILPHGGCLVQQVKLHASNPSTGADRFYLLYLSTFYPKFSLQIALCRLKTKF